MADINNIKELLDIAKSLDCDQSYESFYRFAENYMANAVLKYKSKKQASSLTDILKIIGENPKKNKQYMGKLGNSYDNTIKNWCENICSNTDIQQLAANPESYGDLQYVMAYCARMAKAKKEGV